MNIFLQDKKLIADIADAVYRSRGRQGYRFSREILKIVNESNTALKSAERRKTVRPKRAVRKAKVKICPFNKHGAYAICKKCPGIKGMEFCVV